MIGDYKVCALIMSNIFLKNLFNKMYFLVSSFYLAFFRYGYVELVFVLNMGSENLKLNNTIIEVFNGFLLTCKSRSQTLPHLISAYC